MNIKLNDRVRILREKSGLTQEMLAKLLNITQQTLNKYERGHRVPKADLLNQMVNALECDDPGWLLTGKETGPDKRDCPVKCSGDLIDICKDVKYVIEEGGDFTDALKANIKAFKKSVEMERRLRNLEKGMSGGFDGGIQNPASRTARRRKAG